MSSEQSYFRDLEKLRSLLDRMLQTDADLPPYLRAENQIVTEDIRSYAATVREAFLRGDTAALSSLSLGLAAAGFDRSSEQTPSDVPELDEARERVKRRLSKEDEAQDRHDDGQ